MIWKWLTKWGILIVVSVLVVLYVIIYLFINPKHQSLSLIQFSITSLVSIAIVLYVVYTRELAVSSEETAKASKRTADANIRLVESMQSMLLEQWSCELQEEAPLRGGEEVSKTLYLEDKHMDEEQYNQYMDREQKRTLIFKPLNCGSRPIILNSVKFQISDTRSRSPREISYDSFEPIVIGRDQEKEIFVAYNLEGEMEIRVVEISYQDGDKTQTKWIANAYREISRYQEPESIVSEGDESPPKVPF